MASFYLIMHPATKKNSLNMNVYRKQPAMRDGLWNGSAQKMVLQDGTPKGMKVLQCRCES